MLCECYNYSYDQVNLIWYLKKSLIKIPEKLREILSDEQISLSILSLKKSCEKIMQGSGMRFFQGYTNHDFEHINEILKTYLELIPEGSFQERIFNEKDISLLIGATLLHDIGMHLEKDGFLELVDEKTKFRPLNWYNQTQSDREADIPWPNLWREYINEVNRFGDREFINIIGRVPEKRLEFRDLREHRENWDEDEISLVGEFIRRHHARLAHEIAIYGFPGVKDFPILKELRGSDEKFAFLIGAIARSHGEDLKILVDFLNKEYEGEIIHEGTYCVYHACLLRIADYLQLDFARAPELLLQLKNPSSHISVEEWEAHKAVREINFNLKDPLAIKINLGTNHSLKTHLKLEKHIKGLENEMLICTGQIRICYRDDDNYDHLFLRKSRIVSNINNDSLKGKTTLLTSWIST